MSHFEPIPENKEAIKNNAKKQKRHSKSGWKWLVFTLSLILVGGYAFSALWLAANKDNVSLTENIKHKKLLSGIKAIELQPVLKNDVNKALNSMGLSQNDLKSLSTAMSLAEKNKPDALANGASLVWLEVWDFAAQDGDVVIVESAGYTAEVPLTNMHSVIAIPVAVDKTIKISGIADGGGGITLGISHAGTPISMPIIMPGQIITLSITY